MQIEQDKAGASEPFAKLFETPRGQLLVTFDFDTESETYGLCIRGAAVRGIEPAINFGGWDDREEARKVFDEYTQGDADHAAHEIAKIVDGFSS